MIKEINSSITIVSKDVYEQCQGKTATREVLATLVQFPQLLLEYPLVVNDFVDLLYKIIYSTIYNLARSGAERLSIPAIESYLQEKYPDKYQTYNRHKGSEYLKNALELNTPENFGIYYDEVKKYSLLRDYIASGIDVGTFFNPLEVDPNISAKIADNFNSVTVEQLCDYYKGKVLKLNNPYFGNKKHDSIKAGGDGAKAQKELWKVSNGYGISYASNYLTDATDGLRRKKYTVISAGTGLGKTRMTIANIGHSFAPEFWDEKEKKWKENPNGTQNKCLYIGTEMELRQEVEPILEAYIAAVPEDHILHPDRYEEGEEERVDKAIEILSRGHIYMEYLPDYCLSQLEEVISRHVYEHGVNHVFFDYIHLTAKLSNEYSKKSGLKDREDLVLADVSIHLKEWATKYNISIDTWTQVNGDFAQDSIRDQRLVRGSKAIIDKADMAAILSVPSEAEKRKIDQFLRNCHRILNGRLMCLSIYKNRGSKHTNVKIWLDVEYETMRVHDLFCTNYAYELDTSLSEVVVSVNEDDNTITRYNDYEQMMRLQKKMREAKLGINKENAEEEGNIVEDDVRGYLEEEEDKNTVFNISDLDVDLADVEF